MLGRAENLSESLSPESEILGGRATLAIVLGGLALFALYSPPYFMGQPI
jgi:hypothetical protein